MPRNYERKTGRASYTIEELKSAIAAVQTGTPVREAGRIFGIAEATIRLKMKSNKEMTNKMGRKPVFSVEQEDELANHILHLTELFYGISKVELRKLAYAFAEKKGLKHNFDNSSRMAGKDWINGFLNRNNEINLRKYEAPSISNESVKLFFKNLSEVVRKYNFSPEKIYNVDETCISSIQKPQECGFKDNHEDGTGPVWERGNTVTVISCMSASGNYFPPLFIFPQVDLKMECLEGAQYHCSKNGGITEEVFYVWLQHFHKAVQSSVEDRVLLILDNHTSHISVRIFEFCQLKGIVLISIPPHTSHRLQPLDITFYGPLKGAFSRECGLYLANNANERIVYYTFAQLFNNAYVKTATKDKAISGFRIAGIWPLNPDKMSERVDEFNQENFNLMDEESDPLEPAASTSSARIW